ncbi:MAG: hypothetical protein ACRC1K_00635 [Planctomycetia bacterium]
MSDVDALNDFSIRSSHDAVSIVEHTRMDTRQTRVRCLATPLKPGKLTATIFATSKSAPAVEVKVLVSGDTSDVCDTSPKSLAIKSLPMQIHDRSIEILCSSEMSQNIVVEDVSSDHAEIVVKNWKVVNSQPGKSVVHIELQAPSIPGFRRCLLTLKTESPALKLEVPVACIIVVDDGGERRE